MESTLKGRCSWPKDDPLMLAYHDEEWGMPLHEDNKLFEFLLLDAFQAGLSWKTVLYKRDHFSRAFDGFLPEKIARYNTRKVSRLLEDRGIIRNRLKVLSSIENARQFLRIQEEYGSFGRYIWKFTEGKPRINHWKYPSQVPVSTPQSDAMSRALKKEGFRFVGTTICYSFMQAAGMVNDHLLSCHRYASCSSMA